MTYYHDWTDAEIQAHIENDGCFFMSSTDWLSKNYKTIAEYQSWQQAVNSKEFKE